MTIASLDPRKRTIIAVATGAALLACLGGAFFYELSPAAARGASSVSFTVAQGEGFRAVANGLAAAHLVRSAAAFDAYALFGGRAGEIKPGIYRLNPAMSAAAIMDALIAGGANETAVTVPEGANIYQIDGILSAAHVIAPGALVALENSGSGGNLEGMLFPDTYRFYINTTATSVAQEMESVFAARTEPLFAAAGITSTASGSGMEQVLTLASILEKEVPDQYDQEVVAGILLKRIKAGMPLDVDATVCYAKLLEENRAVSGGPGPSGPLATSCPSLTALDFKIRSPYNTYLYGGLPPGPIGNPGTSSIVAALHPQSSPFWYYLSDPATGKTIFAKTLDEQTANRVKYLESNK